MNAIEARGLSKSYGTKVALDAFDLTVEEGTILGLLGPNGAGKTTALNAMLGLLTCQGELQVLGLDPRADRDRLVSEVAFIADVAVLPRWIRVRQLFDYVAGVHPRFDRAVAERFLATTEITPELRVRQLSKGMVTQLHLAVAMAIDARLLILDEPTLGLDLLYRKRFFDALLEQFFDHGKTIVLATHQVDEIQDLLTDFAFLRHGRVVLRCDMESFEASYVELAVRPETHEAARALGPIRERQRLGRSLLLYDGADREQLAALGELRTPSLAELFVAVLGEPNETALGERR